MYKPVTRLSPPPGQDVPLAGLYLDHRLHERGMAGHPFVFCNFITSLDGRIAIPGNGCATHQVPPSIANLRDWRLYQELAGQADILITSGRLFRQSDAGEQQDKLPVGHETEYRDIREWRTVQGLPAQPDIAIMSGSLDIPPASLEPYHARSIYVVTGEQADAARIRQLEADGVKVIIAGSGRRVDGKQMIDQLAAVGYRSIYAIAGPSVFHTLLEAKTVDRLYLTLACQLLGGDEFDTLAQGRLLAPTGMQLVSLHHDPHAPAGGQLFGVFEPVR